MNKSILKNIGFTAGFLISSLLSSCTDDDTIGQVKQVPLQLSVGIDSITTRSMITGNSFDNGSSIGVFIVDATGLTTYDEKNLHNICYTAQNNNGNQVWTADKSAYLSFTKGGVMGYYPYKDKVALDNVQIRSGSTDYMIGYSNDIVDYNKPNANMTFSHALHAFNINITKNDYLGDGVVSSLTLSSSKLAVSKTVNLLDGTVTYSGEGETLDIPLLKTTLDDVLSQIGQIMAVSTVTGSNTIDLTVKAVVDGKEYTMVRDDLSIDMTDGFCTDLNLYISGSKLYFKSATVAEWRNTDIGDKAIETENGTKINITGLSQDIAVNNNLNDDGSVTITAMPIKKGFFIEDPTITGTGNLTFETDYNTGKLVATLTDYEGDVNITFNGVWEPLVATYNVTDTENPTEISNDISGFSLMAVNGQKVPLSTSHTFPEVGECNVLYKLKDVDIKENAFYQCTELSSIIIPNSVISIGKTAFYMCKGLTGLKIGTGVQTIGSSAFSRCTGLKGELVIPNSVTTIGKYAFYYCTGVTALDLGTGVQTIGGYAFQWCTGLTGTLTIPNSVTEIGSNAFGYCSGLTSLDLREGVQIIGKSAFYECTGLNGTLNIPSSVTYIGSEVFWMCKGFTALDCGTGVQTIGKSAFYGCTGLTGTLTIPNSVTEIGSDAFGYCPGLTSIVVDENNLYYDSRNNCNAIMETATNTLLKGCNNTIIPYNTEIIANSAFYSCTGLTSITIPNTVTKIGGSAFGWCTGLTAVTIPNSVTSIGDYAFYRCTGLTALDLGTGVQTIGREAFYYCFELTGTLTIPNSVTSIGKNAFQNCYGLTALDLGTGVQTIGNYAFYDCTSVKTFISRAINAPIIGDYCFSSDIIIQDASYSLFLTVPTGATGYETWIPSSDTYIFARKGWTIQYSDEL